MEDIYSKTYVDLLTTDQGGIDAFIKKYDSLDHVTRFEIVELLRIAAVDEWLASYNYYASEAHSKTDGKADFDPEFHAHAGEELKHFEDLNMRLREMNQEPLVFPMQSFISMNSSGAAWKQEMNSGDSVEILKRRLDEEKGAVKFYSLVLRVIKRLEDETGEYDSTTETLVKKIKADEEQHERELRELLVQHDGKYSEVVA